MRKFLWLILCGVCGLSTWATRGLDLPENAIDFMYLNEQKLIFGRPTMPEALDKRGAEILISLQLKDAAGNVIVNLDTDVYDPEKIKAIKSILTPWLLTLGANNVFFKSMRTGELIGAPISATPPMPNMPTPTLDEQPPVTAAPPKENAKNKTAAEAVIISQPAEPVKLQPMPEAKPEPQPTTATPEVKPEPQPTTATPEVKPEPQPTTATPEVKPEPQPTTATPEVKPETATLEVKPTTATLEVPQLPTLELPNELPAEVVEPLKTTAPENVEAAKTEVKAQVNAAATEVKKTAETLPPMLQALPAEVPPAPAPAPKTE